MFRAALDRYLGTHGQVMRPLDDPALPPRDAVGRMLRLSARMRTDGTHPSGCLVMMSATVGSSGNRHLQARLAEEQDRNRAALRACVERAVASGELPGGTDDAALAGVFDTFLAGLSTQARDGVPVEALDAAIGNPMRVWDTLRASGTSPQAGQTPR